MITLPKGLASDEEMDIYFREAWREAGERAMLANGWHRIIAYNKTLDCYDFPPNKIRVIA